MKIDKYEIYPMTIVHDRYGGCYSGAKYTAWNCDPNIIPYAQEGSDGECMDFWSDFKQGTLQAPFEELICVGRGNTPDNALLDLALQIALIEEKNKYGK